MSELKEFQLTFIDLALESKALEFGSFTLKSGRKSPYFFNAAKMLNGCNLYKLASCYMKAITEANIEFDSIYGPAYKGIFLGSMVAMMFSKEGSPYPLSFNRKEIKDHGERGNIIGPEPYGNVMIVDDVLSAGTAARESIMLIKSLNATPKVFIVGLDRQEKGTSDISARAELEKEFNMAVKSIINLDKLIQFLKNNDGLNSYLGQLEEYRHVWGA